MKAALVYGAGIFALVLVAENCLHPRPMNIQGVRNLGTSWGVCVEDLTGEPVDAIELDAILEHLGDEWRKLYPGSDPDAILYDFAPKVLLTDTRIGCVHAGPGAWPGDLSMCLGLWPGDGPTIFVKRHPGGLHCSALAHELVHVLSAADTGSADAHHRDKRMWLVVDRVENALGGKCK